MTLSEYLMSHRLHGNATAPPLDCGDGALIQVRPPAGDHVGPWDGFIVSAVGSKVPRELGYPHELGRAMRSIDVVRLLERLGWPEAQLGRRWKKRGVAARE